VNELIKKYNREHITVWGSFSESVTKKCYKINPNIERFFSLVGCLKVIVLMVSGLLPFVALKESYMEIIMPNFMLKDKKNLPFGTLFKLFIVIYKT
jgi:hypothetical protein